MQETHNINFENSVDDYLSSQTARDILVFFFLVQDPLTGGAGRTSLLKMH